MRSQQFTRVTRLALRSDQVIDRDGWRDHFREFGKAQSINIRKAVNVFLVFKGKYPKDSVNLHTDVRSTYEFGGLHCLFLPQLIPAGPAASAWRSSLN